MKAANTNSLVDEPIVGSRFTVAFLLVGNFRLGPSILPQHTNKIEQRREGREADKRETNSVAGEILWRIFCQEGIRSNDATN